ncbi:hypothetical protein BS78_K198000 [Paspalum vaginatum]|uniref:Uncharacterized protein n=1 Tax=Paspalum vaginatum TaxID=158149 RepID=A0A9W7XBX4_9POAL|nr:hypothetical protein BS78_K198000 [Paspalum vaginatum]KAJ1257191.1 hypothetical protein BS78_K198000 [Paspalum vaginatum]
MVYIMCRYGCLHLGGSETISTYLSILKFWSMPSGILWPASLKARGGEFGKFYSLPGSTIQGLIDTAAILSNVQHMAISANWLRVCKLSLTFVLKQCLHLTCTTCDVTMMQISVIV